MIRFSCHCGQVFVLDDSEAAGTVQCPNCKKLNDVPTHHDLQHMDENGLLQLKPLEIEEEPERLANLSRIYSRGRQDETGNDIDFRPTEEEIAARGIPVAREAEQPVRPRYDPETGRLIRPIDLVPAPPRKAIPVAKAAIDYASHSTIRPNALQTKSLLQPINLFVMFCAAVLMFFAGLLGVLALVKFYFFVVPMFALQFLVIAHYGATIEELGPRGKDELPRMFGDFQFYDDIWLPFWAIAMSLLICYGPAVAAFNLQIPAVIAVGLGLLLAGAGTILFPAVSLTLVTSGTISNLRPDRLYGTILACGTSYVLPMVSWTLAGWIYLWAVLRFVSPILGQARPFLAMLPDTITMVAALPMVQVLTVPITHIFAWQTGVLYQRHYESFPWVGQRFEKRAVAKKI